MGCATERCADPDCPVCTVNARFAIVACQGEVDGKPCKYVESHPGACVAEPRAGKVEQAEPKKKEPLPDLSAPHAAANALAFKKRRREGPFRQQRA